MHDYFDHVENGQVKQMNVRRGGKFQGRNLGKESPDAVYKLLFGLWPRTGEMPAYNPDTQTCREIERLVDTENEVTIRQWVVEDRPLTELQNKLKSACEKAIEKHIQSKVDDYNTANDLMIRDIYSCAHYALVDGYTHQTFCAAAWAWNVSVWETARDLLAQAKAGQITVTAPAEVIAMLPEFTG